CARGALYYGSSLDVW
nr:immunoglobulin heavy chain junction region [Mus musculus]